MGNGYRIRVNTQGKKLMKKLLFYINVLCYGGAERVISTLANQFVKDHYEVFFVTSYPNEHEYELNALIQRINLEESNVKGFLKRNIIFTKKLRKTIKEIKPDMVISFLPEPNFRNIIASIGLKNKVVISVRNDPNKEYGRKLYSILAKALYPRANGIVFQTQEAGRWFSQNIRKKSRIIYNNVSPVFYEEYNKLYNKDIVSVGSFKKQKNQKLLIKAFADISNDINENLHIYGEGGLRVELETYIDELGMNDRIILEGEVANIQEELKRYKLFVLPSDYEGLPNALMEAMAIGLPCIASDCPCGGPRELFENHEKYLFKVRDLEDLKKKMLKFLLDEKARQQNADYMKKRSFVFKTENVYKEWKEYFNEIASGR